MDSQRYNTITKITCPLLSGVIDRQRLFKRLDTERNKRIIWVSGPGGSGKTTLVASYLSSRKLPALWYQVDAEDADLSTFFYYLSLAAKKAAPKARKPLPLLTPEYLLGVAVFARRYFESLFSRLKTPSAIVFDNYQDVPSESGFHELIHTVLPLVPEDIQIILISRNEPPPALVRLRANNVMAVLGWDELRLDPVEIEEFVRLKLGKEPNPDALSGLRAASDGWAAGLVLMVEGGASGKATTPEQSELPKERIFEYFAAEVFEKLGKETRDLLLKTAYFPKLTAEMARKLTGLGHADQILFDLNRHNFFTTRHTHHEAAYQYHPLFREFLLTRCDRIFFSDEIASLKKRSAIILEEAGQGEAAVELFQQAGDWQNAARLIARLAPGLIAQGRALVVKGWVEGMPPEALEQSPWLQYWHGICLMAFNPAESKKAFDRAFSVFRAKDDRVGQFLSWAGAVDCAFFGADFVSLDKMILLLENMLRENASFPTSEIEAVVTAGMFGALSFRQPQYPGMHLWENKALDFFRSSPATDLGTKTGVYLTVYYLWIGDFSKALLVLEWLRKSLTTWTSDLTRVTIKTTEALFDFFTADCASCVQKTFEIIRVGEKTGVRVWETHAIGHGLVAALSNGDLQTAAILFDKMNPDPTLTGRFDTHYYHFAKIWKALIEGDGITARRHYVEFTRIMEKVGDIHSIAVSKIVMYEMTYEQGNAAEAEQHLSAAYELAFGMKSFMLEYMCLIIQAHILFKNGSDDEKGLMLLRKAMALGREKGFMNMYWWRPAVMANLCAKALEAGIETEYVQRLIRKRGLVPVENSLVPENWPYPLQVYTLGKFEIMTTGKPVVFSGKAQQKPLALLKALIALGGEEVPEERIVDALWPEADGYSAHRSCELALYRLRKILGNDKAVQLHDGKLNLDKRYCSVDVWDLERIYERAEQGWRTFQEEEKGKKGVKPRTGSESVVQLTENALARYRGHFLTGDVKEPWTSSLRDRLKSKFVHFTSMLGRYWEEEGTFEQSAACFQKGLELDDLCEEFYQRLMVCYLKLGRKADAVTTYQRCRNQLFTALGITPSGVTEEIYSAIRRT